MSSVDERPVRVEWQWSLPPFRAYFTRESGGQTGVLRWTPQAARYRAEDLRDVYEMRRQAGRREDQRFKREQAARFRELIEVVPSAEPKIRAEAARWGITL